MEFLGCSVFLAGVFSDAVEFLGVVFSVMLIFWAGRFLIFWRSIFSVFEILPSFASLYRFIFACFGCFLWVACCSARLSCVAYFSFFKGSWLNYSSCLLFVCVVCILYFFFILSLAIGWEIVINSLGQMLWGSDFRLFDWWNAKQKKSPKIWQISAICV